MFNRLKKSLPDHWVFWVLVAALVIASAMTAYTIFSTVRNTFAQSGNSPTLPEEVEHNDGEIPFQTLTDPLQTTNRPDAQAWDGKSRINLLLLGVDNRSWTTYQGPPRTDTIILVTIDPETESAKMLSIPRDLWVEIPGFGGYKINQAYPLGESQGLPTGGPGLILDTVEQFLDIEIPFYVQINFESFIHIVDEIGGVKVNVPNPLVVNLLHGQHCIKLEPGIQTLTGDIALAYARARNSAGSDFDRAQRQQQVIRAFSRRINNFNLLPDLISNAPAIYKEVVQGLETNLSMLQIAQLAQLGYTISPADLQSLAIGPKDVTNSTSYNGLSILLPIPEKLQKLRDEFLSYEPLPAAAPTPTVFIPIQDADGTQQAPTTVPDEEHARVTLQNGTLVPGLASETQTLLASHAITVAGIGNADGIYAETIIIDYSDNPNTVNQLMTILAVPPRNVYNRYDANIKVDILVILGEAWANREKP
ncbi:MAG: LCP family protein [Chloroflexota bacterium]